ncbi:MAG: ankyrin repeat domain-containing protein [Bacteroidia bacterium]
MKENAAMNMVRSSVIFLAGFLLMINSVGIAVADVDKTDSAVQPIIDNLAKNENVKITIEDINVHNILGKNFLVILPGLDMEGHIIRGASGNGDILVYMKKDSNYILAGKLDGNSYELKEMRGKVSLIKRSHAGGGWEPPTAYELSGENFVESDKYEVLNRNNTSWFDVNARISPLYDLSDEVTIKTVLERALEEGNNKSGNYGYISVHVYQNDKLAVDFEGVADNLDTTEKVITASKIDNLAKRNQENIISELRKGNVSVVRSMIENGTNVDARDEGSMEGEKVAGPTLLMLTACGKDCNVNLTEEDQISLLKLLLNKGADVNANVPWGETVLTYAIAGEKHEGKTEEETKGGFSRLPIVKMLLDRGAKPNVGGAYEHTMWGVTCLTRAAKHGYYQVVSLLFQYGAHEGLDQAYKFAKDQNHAQTAKLIQDKFWSNFKSNCLTNSGFSKSLIIGDPIDTENYAISIVQGKRTSSDSDISTAICIFDKINEKIEFAELSAFKKFPFALAALAKSKDKQLQQEAQKLTCNAAQQLLSNEPVLDQSKEFSCIYNSKYTKSIIIGEPTYTDNFSVFLIQGKRSKMDTNLSTAICIYDKKSERMEFIEPDAFTTYPFALATLAQNKDAQTQPDSNKSNCNEAQQLFNNYIDSNKLTRNEAKELLAKYLYNSKYRTVLLQISYGDTSDRQFYDIRNTTSLQRCYAEKANAYNHAANEGYLILSIISDGVREIRIDPISIYRHFTKCNINFGDKIRPYLFSYNKDSAEVIIAMKSIASISGITPISGIGNMPTEMRVEFQIKYTPTPLAEVFAQLIFPNGILPKDITIPFNKVSYFQLYDDGWRVREADFYDRY